MLIGHFFVLVLLGPLERLCLLGPSIRQVLFLLLSYSVPFGRVNRSNKKRDNFSVAACRCKPIRVANPLPTCTVMLTRADASTNGNRGINQIFGLAVQVASQVALVPIRTCGNTR